MSCKARFSVVHPRADLAATLKHFAFGPLTGRVVTPQPEGPGLAGQEAVVQGLADFVRPG
jgi:hypothetical protein